MQVMQHRHHGLGLVDLCVERPAAEGHQGLLGQHDGHAHQRPGPVHRPQPPLALALTVDARSGQQGGVAGLLEEPPGEGRGRLHQMQHLQHRQHLHGAVQVCPRVQALETDALPVRTDGGQGGEGGAQVRAVPGRRQQVGGRQALRGVREEQVQRSQQMQVQGLRQIHLHLGQQERLLYHHPRDKSEEREGGDNRVGYSASRCCSELMKLRGLLPPEKLPRPSQDDWD